MPKPSSAATVLVVHTPRIRIMRMSTSGLGLRDSLCIHATRSTMPTANAIKVLAESQPHTGASLTASRTAASPPDMSAAPAQFTRPGTRTGDSGTNLCTASVAGTSSTNGNQNR